MNEIAVDVFAEDRAHEEFLRALVHRLTREEGQYASVQVRAARGGHGRALDEFVDYQKLVEKGVVALPDLIIVAIDANCAKFREAQRAIGERVDNSLKDRTVIACPDPHIERWYVADPVSFHQVVGSQPRIEKIKCERDRYKKLLIAAIRDAGHIPTLDGMEFARELVEAMDLYRVARYDQSLDSFIKDVRSAIRRIAQVREVSQ
jgi:hypothetical protein